MLALLRSLAIRILPARWYSTVRRMYGKRFPASAMVTTESWTSRTFQRHVLRAKPTLHHFEIHVTDHCNLNCRGCAHFSNISPPWFADPEAFRSDMQVMGRLFRVDQIYVLGGEPLLHPDLVRFLDISREVFPETRIYLLTNGLLLTKMPDEFWSALARTRSILLVDDYPTGIPVEEIKRLSAERDVTLEWTPRREEFFRLPIDLDRKHDSFESFRRCQGYNNCPIVRNGRLYPCAYIAYSDVLEQRFSIETGDSVASSISIHDADDAWAVMDFLLQPVPWCAHCDFGNFSFQKWGRTRRDLSEWVDIPGEIGSRDGAPAPELGTTCAGPGC